MLAFGVKFSNLRCDRTFTVPGPVFLHADLGYRLQDGRPRLCVSPQTTGRVNDTWIVRVAPENRPHLLIKNTYGFTHPFDDTPAR